MRKFKCCVDADFVEKYSKDTCEDPNQSRTGCVIKYVGFHIAWLSRLYTEISLSTSEAECIALSTATREVLPLRELILELKTIIDIPEADLNIHCKLFGNNTGIENLAKVPDNMPRSKHIAVKYHNF